MQQKQPQKDSILLESESADSDDFDSVELNEDSVDFVPRIVKTLANVENTKGITNHRPLEDQVEDIKMDYAIQYENFENKKQMKRYQTNDYKVKKFLMMCTAGRQKKIWMPGKTVFDKRGGKFSERVAGLGQIPGMQ